jgi:hypothetical protein
MSNVIENPLIKKWRKKLRSQDGRKGPQIDELYDRLSNGDVIARYAATCNHGINGVLAEILEFIGG